MYFNKRRIILKYFRFHLSGSRSPEGPSKKISGGEADFREYKYKDGRTPINVDFWQNDRYPKNSKKFLQKFTLLSDLKTQNFYQKYYSIDYHLTNTLISSKLFGSTSNFRRIRSIMYNI